MRAGSGGGWRPATATRSSHDLDDALGQVQKARQEKRAFSVGLVGNIADVLPELVRRGVSPTC